MKCRVQCTVCSVQTTHLILDKLAGSEVLDRLCLEDVRLLLHLLDDELLPDVVFVLAAGLQVHLPGRGDTSVTRRVNVDIAIDIAMCQSFIS